MKPKLQVSRVSFSYHSKNRETLALSDISFNVDTGEFIAIVGPSGCGKSTLLSLLCGLNMPEAGAIFLDGELLEKNPKNATGIGYMFQKDHLFEWRDIFSNVSLGLEIQKKLNTETKQELSDLLSDYGLAGFEHAKPSALSGGMRQRVVIALALSADPKLIIADEPTTALDVSVQAQIIELLKKLCEENGTAVILVTHDMGVIAEAADRVAVMYAGRLVELADKRTLFNEPRHPYTRMLLDAIPDLSQTHRRRTPISGEVPNPLSPPTGCPFHPRCPLANERCRKEMPPQRNAASTND